ncbi:MAG: hypothetical protein ACOQNY_00085 [Mycoplasmoidaceae bacterium]
MTTEKVPTFSNKPQRVKWPIKKFLNKFFIYNVFECIGITMLFLSVFCQDAFHGDQTKIIGNIVASLLVTAAGVGGGIIYSLFLTFKGETPLARKFANLTKWFFWVPILGIVFDKMWKHYELNYRYALKLKTNPNFEKPKTALPSSVALIFAALVGVVFVIWILYLGGIVIPDESKGEYIPGILDIFLNPLRGFAGYQAGDVFKPGIASIAIFLLLFNGAMTLVNDAHAIEAGIGGLLKKMKGKEIILIPVLMFILAICGSTFNMCEQLLPIFLVIIPIMFAAGYDAMTGFIMVNMGAGVGVMASTVNPVLIGTCVTMQDVPEELKVGMMDGITWRLVMFAGLVTVSILCTMIYAKRVKAKPQRSCVYISEEDFKKKYSFDKDALPPMTPKRKWTLIVFGLAFAMLIVGFVDWQAITGYGGFQSAHDLLMKVFPFLTSIDPIGKWGMIEAGLLFFVASLIIGAINWKGAGHFFGTFYQGCKDFVPVIFIVAVAKGLSLTLMNSGLNQTISQGLGGILGKMPAIGAIAMIFLVIALLTIFIPSSSGLSAAMFPVISSSVAQAGTVSVSSAITTFAAGMGWTNLFTPTGMALPFCEIAKIDYGDFIKGSWKHIGILLIAGLGLMAAGTFTGAGMF